MNINLSGHSMLSIFVLTNIYNWGGVKFNIPTSVSSEFISTTYPFGRLFAHPMQKVALVFVLTFFLSSCGGSIPPSEDETIPPRGEVNEPDSTHSINGWDQPDTTAHIVMTGSEVISN